LDPAAAPSRDRRSASSVNDNAVTVIERSCQTRIAVAASDNFRSRPDLETDLPERAAVFFRCATCQENSRAIDFLGQFGKDRSETFRRSQSKVRRRQFSLLDDVELWTGVSALGHSFHQSPGGFRPAAFDAEDALTAFHYFPMLSWFCVKLKAW